MNELIDSNAPVEELVSAVLDRPSLMKKVGPVLEKRPPSEAGARLIVSRYQVEKCPPWLAAYLLGCIGHELGYDAVMHVLMVAPGSLAESYAGFALVQIDPVRASVDLLHVLEEAPHHKSRAGAASGLGQLPLTREIALALFNASLNHRVPSYLVASVLWKGVERSEAMLGYVLGLLTTPLESKEYERRRLVTEVALDTVLSPSSFSKRETLMNRLRTTVAEILNDPDFKMRPFKRAKLKDWVRRGRPV